MGGDVGNKNISSFLWNRNVNCQVMLKSMCWILNWTSIEHFNFLNVIPGGGEAKLSCKLMDVYDPKTLW